MEKRNIELFIAGCPACEPAVELVKSLICNSCNLQIYNVALADDIINKKIKNYNINVIPSVAVNGKLLQCCTGNGLNKEELIKVGIGKA